ncbi:histone-like protein [Streptomyces violascens]|uniref:histone-like protein n=1 Tax=Streptomyces violascens TaxID=67381 RepID=UPI0036C1A165
MTSPTNSDARPLPKPALIKRSMQQRTRLRISKDAAVATGAAVGYILSEVIEGAGNVAAEEGKKKIAPRHIGIAIRKDEELAALGRSWLIRPGGAAGHLKPLDESGQAVPPTTPASNPRKRSALTNAHQYQGFVKRLAKARQLPVAASSVEALNNIASDLVERIAAAAGELAAKTDRQTIAADDVQGAVSGLLTGELRQHVLAEIRRP